MSKAGLITRRSVLSALAVAPIIPIAGEKDAAGVEWTPITPTKRSVIGRKLNVVTITVTRDFPLGVSSLLSINDVVYRVVFARFSGDTKVMELAPVT